MREEVNVIVIGAGPAGSAAAMFLKRAGAEPLVLEESEPGGLLGEANLVENYPGFPDGIPGKPLVDLMTRQMERLNVRIIRKSVESVVSEGRRFIVRTADGAEYETHAVVVASGTAPRKLEAEWADGLEGRTLFYGLSSLDVEDIKGARIAVLGGGDAAFDYALNLRARGGTVRVILRSVPSCLPLLLERAAARGIEVLEGYHVERVEESPRGIRIVCADKREHACDLIIVAHGREPRLEALSDDLKECVSSSEGMYPETTLEGFYVAGDVARDRFRQTAIAVGDGVLAAMKVMELLRKRGVCA